MPAENIFIIENGQPIEFFADGTIRRGTPVEAGKVFVDGLSVGEVGDVVLRDRRALASDGMFLVVVTVDRQTGSLVGKPEIVTRGFVATPDAALLAGATDASRGVFEGPGDRISEIALLKEQIKDGLSQYLYEQTRRRPMVLPVVIEVYARAPSRGSSSRSSAKARTRPSTGRGDPAARAQDRPRAHGRARHGPLHRGRGAHRPGCITLASLFLAAAGGVR